MKKNVFTQKKKTWPQFVRYSYSNTWFLLKESNNQKRLKIPSYVDTILPIKIVYTNSKGESFSCFGSNIWTSEENTKTCQGIPENVYSIQIVKKPQNPIINDFSRSSLFFCVKTFFFHATEPKDIILSFKSLG